jgi:hypothetical protein
MSDNSEGLTVAPGLYFVVQSVILLVFSPPHAGGAAGDRVAPGACVKPKPIALSEEYRA